MYLSLPNTVNIFFDPFVHFLLFLVGREKILILKKTGSSKIVSIGVVPMSQ